MIKLDLPFWLDGIELGKLKTAAFNWWTLAEGWLAWPLGQLDARTCALPMLDLLAYQRDITRFTGEPEDLFRLRVHYAFVNAQDAGSEAGFIRIFDRLGIGYVTLTERFDAVNWDVIRINLSDEQLAGNTDLLANIIQQYGRTCRRYTFTVITPLKMRTPVWELGHVWGYDVAGD